MKRIVILLLSAISLQISAFAQGPLTPPGPPAPAFKTLQQVEPRTAITNVPYFITQPGSYYFVTNFTGVSGAGVTISNSDVTLDLNGFTLAGATSDGIRATAVTNITIRNGTVRGCLDAGVDVTFAANSTLQDLHASGNATAGLSIGQGGLVSGCTVMTNGFAGIVTGSRCTIIHCTSAFNKFIGFDTFSHATLVNCTAANNGANGMEIGSDSLVIGCNVSSNTGTGIVAGTSSTIADCNVSGNGGDGMQVGSGCYVTRNDCHFNGETAIRAIAGYNRIDANNVVQNGRGILLTLAGSTNVVVRNTAGRHPQNSPNLASNYVFTGFVIFGPTNNVFNTTGLITNDNPWANISY